MHSTTSVNSSTVYVTTGQSHRKTADGRLCAAAFIHNSQAFTVADFDGTQDSDAIVHGLYCIQDCTTVNNPDGVSGREWCYVEVSKTIWVMIIILCATAWYVFATGSSRECRATDMGIASGLDMSVFISLNLYDYCVPKVNYVEVRDRVSIAYAEKANEIADATSLVQSLSREAVALLQQVSDHCIS